MSAANDELTITTDGTYWFNTPPGPGLTTLKMKFVGAATGTAKLVVSDDNSSSENTGAGLQNGTQVSFDGGGDYNSYYVDISAWKYIGVELSSLSGTFKAKLLQSSV